MKGFSCLAGGFPDAVSVFGWCLCSLRHAASWQSLWPVTDLSRLRGVCFCRQGRWEKLSPFCWLMNQARLKPGWTCTPGALVSQRGLCCLARVCSCQCGVAPPALLGLGLCRWLPQPGRGRSCAGGCAGWNQRRDIIFPLWLGWKCCSAPVTLLDGEERFPSRRKQLCSGCECPVLRICFL